MQFHYRIKIAMQAIFVFILGMAGLWAGIRPVLAQQPVVHAVLFYSPSCGHCHKVMTEDLPPLLEKYGSQLEIVLIDVTFEQGQTLFLAALEMAGIDQGGVPTLVVDTHVLIGSIDIPEKFPGLVDHYLLQGGLDWPPIPGLLEAMQAAQAAQTAQADPAVTPASSAAGSVEATAVPAAAASSDTVPQQPASLVDDPSLASFDADVTLLERLANDPAGNALAILVLIGMLVSAGGALAALRRPTPLQMFKQWQLAVPVLCLVGIGVAGYLAYVEATHTEAVCGPVGDCNTVQQSEYARLFGFLPVGVLGVVGYVLILLAWFIGRSSQNQTARLARLALLVMTACGLLFSIYLTFLEPFVIGASCAWCLASAVLMTALFWLSFGNGKEALDRWRIEDRPDFRPEAF